MKMTYVTDLNNQMNKEINIGLFVKSLNKVIKGERTYVAMTLVDRTGEITGKIWSEYLLEEHFTLNEKYVVVKAKVEEYQGKPHLKILAAAEMKEEKVCIDDYINMPADSKEMLEKLKWAINRVEQPFLFSILSAVFSKPTTINSFLLSQGGTESHHCYPGGLSVHTFTVLEGIMGYVQRKSGHIHEVEVDMDMLITGALLHDIGKIHEFKPFPVNKKTRVGKLLGRTALSLDVLTAAFYEVMAREPGCINYVVFENLKHMIIASSGSKWAVSPKTVEAVLLCKFDELDSYYASVEQTIYADKESTKGDKFTNYNELIGTQILKKEVS